MVIILFRTTKRDPFEKSVYCATDRVCLMLTQFHNIKITFSNHRSVGPCIVRTALEKKNRFKKKFTKFVQFIKLFKDGKCTLTKTLIWRRKLTYEINKLLISINKKCV